MADAWAVRLPAKSRHRLGHLRRSPGVVAYGNADAVWLRGAGCEPDLDRGLRALGGQRFHVAGDGRLTPWDCRVPTGILPDGPWTPLDA